MMLAATMIFGAMAVFSSLMLGEPITLRQVAGIIIVFIGVLITVDPSSERDGMTAS